MLRFVTVTLNQFESYFDGLSENRYAPLRPLLPTHPQFTPSSGVSAQSPAMVRMSAKRGATGNRLSTWAWSARRRGPGTSLKQRGYWTPCQNFLTSPYRPRSCQWDRCWDHPIFHQDRPLKRHRIPRNRRHIVGFLPKRVVHSAEVGQTNDRYS
jgi:hypothetical protein